MNLSLYPVDFLGRELRRGHRIVYSVKHGSSGVKPVLAEIQDIVVNPHGDYVLKITRFREGKRAIGTLSYEDPERVVSLHKFENCVIVPPDSK